MCRERLFLKPRPPPPAPRSICVCTIANIQHAHVVNDAPRMICFYYRKHFPGQAGTDEMHWRDWMSSLGITYVCRFVEVHLVEAYPGA